MLLTKNNNACSDRIKKKELVRKHQMKKKTETTCFQEFQEWCDDTVFTAKLHCRYTLAPILKTLPGLLFRIFGYCLILSYLSDFYTGMGYLIPLGLVVGVVVLQFIAGKMIELRDEEAIVNAFCGVTLPVYLDVFPIVSIVKTGRYIILSPI